MEHSDSPMPGTSLPAECSADSLALAPLGAGDAREMAELEQACFTLPWSEEQYHSAFETPVFHAWGLRGNDGLLAYVTAYAVGGTLEILNVATRPDCRRRGLGRRLLSNVLHLAETMGNVEAVLEVRQHNTPAMGLYEGLGFRRAGRRKGYYPDTGEDALIYTLTFMT